jgi:hypothetical protein
MLKRLQPDRDLSALVSSRNAVHFLHEESRANGNADITALLGEALTCGDELIAGKQEISYKSKDALLYLFFLRAIIGLHPKQIGHLVELMQWLKIVPCENPKGE